MRWLILLLLIACTVEDVNVPEPNIPRETVRVPEPKIPQETVVPFTNYTVTQSDTITSYTINNNGCTKAKGTPIIVNGYVVFNLYDNDCKGPHGDTLFALDPNTQTLYDLGDYGSSEGTMLYNNDQLFIPSLDSAYYLLDISNIMQPVLLHDNRRMKSVDSAALFFNDHYYVGTINHPNPLCQRDVNIDCGAFLKIDMTGQIVDRLDLQDGHRAWHTGAPTTNGEHIFIGTGTDIKGDTDTEYLHGCSVLKLDENLNVLAIADPELQGCSEVEGTKLETAVTGEVALGPNNVWVQFVGPEQHDETAVIQYDHDLNEICRAYFPRMSQYASAGYYQAPTIDADGNAYVTIQHAENQAKLTAYKIDTDCVPTKLADAVGYDGVPLTLTNQGVLFLSPGQLQIVSETTQTIKLPAGSVTSAPIVHNGDVYVLTEEGTLHVIKHDLEYAEGWPRLRGDNHGSATLS